jgi:hypothetical protein
MTADIQGGIQFTDLELFERLGEGLFGSVYRGDYLVNSNSIYYIMH